MYLRSYVPFKSVVVTELVVSRTQIGGQVVVLPASSRFTNYTHGVSMLETRRLLLKRESGIHNAAQPQSAARSRVYPSISH